VSPVQIWASAPTTFLRVRSRLDNWHRSTFSQATQWLNPALSDIATAVKDVRTWRHSQRRALLTTAWRGHLVPKQARPDKTADPKRPARQSAAQPRHESAPAAVLEAADAAPVDVQALLHLQRTLGNRAVAQLVAQRQVRAAPEADPKFRELTAEVGQKQRALYAPRGGPAAAQDAQDAAVAPPDDREAQGKTAQAGKMAASPVGTFDKAAFIAAVDQAIAAQAPKTLDDADQFATSGKAAQIKGAVQGHVTEGKRATAGPITDATRAAPDLSAARDRPVTPLSPDRPPPVPGAPDPSKAVPDRAPASATDLSAGPRQVDDELAKNEITEKQLEDGNEPEFDAALQRKKELEAHSATAPGQVRASEARTLDAAKADAHTAGAAAMTAMGARRSQIGEGVHQGQQTTRGSDETKRAQVTAVLQKVFDGTRRDVEEILGGLDHKVDQQFDVEEGTARKAFEADMQKRMDEYKSQRYGGFTGKLRWVKDKLMGLPPEANQIFVAARAGYVASMRQVISRIADTIGAELTRAKTRVAQGRAELESEVGKLPADLRALGQQAAAGFTSQFEELNASVDARGQELVQTLASKYADATKAVDAEIDAEKARNEGLVATAVTAIKGVVDSIVELKNLLMGVLARAADAIGPIIAHPIAFLGNLISAVGGGLRGFIANIGDHLKKGLVSWLMGAATESGLEIPEKFDLKGIVQMVASLLGLTWQSIRARIVGRGVPDEAVSAAEQAVPEAQMLAREGLPGLWQQIVSKIGDLKGMILGRLTEFLIPSVLVAGITWIISLLNPASAFVKAVKAIIDIVTFIAERGAQIVQFVNAVIDAIVAIAKGGAGGVAELIENALAKSIPVLIGFLASILGIGGIANKVKEVIQAVARPVTKVVNWVVDKIVGVAKKIWAKTRGLFGKAFGKKGPESEADKRKRLDAGVRAGVAAVNRLSGNRVGAALIRPVLASIRLRYRMQVLEPVVREGKWSVHGVVNPEKEESTSKEAGGVDDSKFPFEITAATKGHIKTAPIGNAVEHFTEIERAPMEGADPTTGFVVNIATIPSEVKPGMAARYLGAAWDGAGAGTIAAERTAVVIGVNTMEKLDPAANQTASQGVIAKLGAITRPAGLQMAVFGFSWAPTWIQKGGGPADISVVRAAYEKLSPAERQHVKEGGLAAKEALPYGIFRETVLGSPYTKRAVDILSKVNRQVHVLSQDADTDVAARSGRGILAEYTRILSDMGQHPLLTIGGYHFQGFDWGREAGSRKEQLTNLANELDRAVRVAINETEHRQMLYPTEPNMLIKAWDADVRNGIFQRQAVIDALAHDPGSVYGTAHAEGRNLRNNLMKTYGDDFSMVYRPEAGVTTSPVPERPERGLTVYPENVGAGGKHRVDAVLNQSQSYAQAETLAREFSKANPKLSRDNQNTLRDLIFRHFEQVARMMVDNPALTKDGPEIEQLVAALRQRVASFTGNVGLDAPSPALKQAANAAHDLMGHLITVMTAPEFKEYWGRLRTQLDAIVQERQHGGGAQQ
jgi:hypothetical protein